MLKYLKNKSKLSQDLLWNYISLVILAASGVLINFIIAAFYGADTLGRFNLLYAIYIVSSQLCIGGIHYSVLKHLAVIKHGQKIRNQIIGSGLLLGAGLSVISSSLIACAHNLIGELLHSIVISKGLLLLAPALVFFSLNKVMLAALNGQRYMKTYAVGQALRYILMISYIMVTAFFKKQEILLAGNFLFAEAILAVFLFVALNSTLKHLRLELSKKWLTTHTFFGLRGALIGIFLELNTRVDVLILGLFVTNKQVGIYSFSAMLIEGLYQFLIVIRNNVNPLLAMNLETKNFNEIGILVKRMRKYIYPAIATLCCTLLFIVYPVIIYYILPNKGLEQGWPVLIILGLGVCISSGFIPFDNILTQGGYPGQQTLQNMFIVFTNILLNFIFVYFWGIIGAAIATMIASYLLSIIYLNFLTNKHLKINIFTLKPTY